MIERFARIETADGRRLWVALDSGGAEALSHAPWSGGDRTGERVDCASSRLLFPVAPSKIVCIGRNYRAHARELGNEVPSEPLLFLKPPSSLLDPGGRVLLPPESARVEHEIELAAVIGTRCRGLDPTKALAHVFGYTIACDVSARDLQKKDGQWTRAKGFDTFCPVGPEVVRGLDPSALGLRLWVDGELRQNGTTADMVFDVAALVAYVSGVMTLEPGDLILTGTPGGVGPLEAGAHVRLEIDALGALELEVGNATA